VKTSPAELAPAVETLGRSLANCRRLFVITGAGCSAPSGIATYRDAEGQWQHPQPVQQQDFLHDPFVRQRYWARSFHGWPIISQAKPNAAHVALAELEAQFSVLLTQNVDGLHQQAGQRKLIELHGSLADVVCLSCGDRTSRALLQRWIEDNNPQFTESTAIAGPDGDADIALSSGARVSEFRVPECVRCGGVVKPDVVFYGDAVPPERVAGAFTLLAESDGLLVVGSSLMVYSSFRFCRRARELGIPQFAINVGKTRADAWFECKIEFDCAQVLPKLCRAWLQAPAASVCQR
jgi:NAD-dependent SIR2 family protein deacetylase